MLKNAFVEWFVHPNEFKPVLYIAPPATLAYTVCFDAKYTQNRANKQSHSPQNIKIWFLHDGQVELVVPLIIT